MHILSYFLVVFFSHFGVKNRVGEFSLCAVGGKKSATNIVPLLSQNAFVHPHVQYLPHLFLKLWVYIFSVD